MRDRAVQHAITQIASGTYLSDAPTKDIGPTIAAEPGLRPSADELSRVATGALAVASAPVAAKLDGYSDR